MSYGRAGRTYLVCTDKYAHSTKIAEGHKERILLSLSSPRLRILFGWVFDWCFLESVTLHNSPWRKQPTIFDRLDPGIAVSTSFKFLSNVSYYRVVDISVVFGV